MFDYTRAQNIRVRISEAERSNDRSVKADLVSLRRAMRTEKERLVDAMVADCKGEDAALEVSDVSAPRRRRAAVQSLRAQTAAVDAQDDVDRAVAELTGSMVNYPALKDRAWP